MTKGHYRCVNGFRTISGKKAISPRGNAAGLRTCTSACCLTIVGGRLHRCGFLAEYKKRD